MISENKIKHMLGVARKCRDLAINKNLPEDIVDAMFIMGLLHDIGYEYEPDSNHGHRSFEMILHFIKHHELANDAIMTHGLTTPNMTWSIFDEILNHADMTTSYNGEPVDITTRLNGIKQNWPETSVHYKHATEIAEKLQALGLE